MKQCFVATVLVLTLAACEVGESPDARYDSGYSDGYAAGYNTACKIRATIIEGDWDDADYTRGYNEGQSAGSRVDVHHCEAH